MPYLQVAKRLSINRAVLARRRQTVSRLPAAGFMVVMLSCICQQTTAPLSASDNSPVDQAATSSVDRSHPPTHDPPAPQPPLYQRIDALIHQSAIGPLAPRSSDADFLRRIYLDLTGVIPTPEQVREFLADTGQGKRLRLIEQLLQSADFNRHFALRLNTMLMDQRTEKYVDQKAWENYLIGSLAAAKPLDQIFRELVYPDDLTAEPAPARKFLLIRDVEPHAMTRDVGRLLFGMDLQCAQCHDHPLIADYFQADYYGLFAFLNRTQLFEDPQSKVGQLAELALGEAQYESVFTGDSDPAARPRLPHGASVFEEPNYDESEAYVVKPDKTAAAKPKYSRRQVLAQRLADNPQFRRNLANRLWALVMGRGLVHPQDFHYADNPPTHPQLLELLAEDLAQHDFDLRYAVGQLVRSQTYQRDCTPPQPETINLSDVAARRTLVTQQLTEATAQQPPLAAALTEAQDNWRTAVEAKAQRAEQLTSVRAKLKENEQLLTAADANLVQADAQLAELQQRTQSIISVLTPARHALAQLSDETALRDSVEILQRRASELGVTLQQAQDQRAQKLVAAQAARQAVEQLSAEMKSLQTQLADVSTLAQLEHAAQVARRAHDEALARHRLLQRQLELCNDLLAFPDQVVAAPQQAAANWESIVEQWTLLGQVAPLKPLTPEQLAASAMQATGFLSRSLAAAQAALDKSTQAKQEASTQHQTDQPPRATSEQPPQPVREAALQSELLDQLRGNIAQFVTQFGGLSGEEFQATVNQALFLGNSPALSGWLVAEENTLVGRLAKLPSPSTIADELTLAVLSRPATLDEQRELATFLEAAGELASPDRAQAIAEIAWALIASNEFRFNH